MGPVFLTGGSGLLGREVGRRLVAEGRGVVALARSDESAKALTDLGVTRVVRGDVLDRGALDDGLAGCEAVYHLAGVNAFCMADPGPMYLVNIEGSRRVVEAAVRAGVDRVVYTSSAAALGEVKGTIGTESAVHRGSYLSHYERSKHLAEEAVRGVAERAGIDVVYVQPASVQGPGRAGGTGRLLLDFVNGRLKAIVDTRLSIVDIADCTEGHLLAERHGAAGERYLLSGHTLTVAEGIDRLRRVTGVDYRLRTLPGPVATAAAGAFAGIQRARRRRPKFCPEMVRTMRHGHAYDGSKATRALGLSYTPFDDTLRRTVEWFLAEGLVTRPLPDFGGDA